MDVIVGLAVTSLVVLFLIHSTQSNYNIVDKFVDSTQGVRFRVKTQKYKKIPNKYLRQEEINSWHFLTPEALEMTLPQCGRTCLETTDCTGFFFFKSETKSCFMNENAISLNKLEVKNNIDFYEIEVSFLSSFSFTKGLHYCLRACGPLWLANSASRVQFPA